MTESSTQIHFRSEILELDPGHRVHVEIGGRGAPLLLLHGFTGSTRTLQALAERFARAHRTIRLDLPGHGRTVVPPEPESFGMSATTSSVARALDRILPAPETSDEDEFGKLWKVADAHVLGYSMGGRVSLGLAAHHPGRVRSLVLIGSSAGIEDAREREQRREADEELTRLLLRDGITAFVDRWMRSDFFETQREMGATHWDAARTQRLANQPIGLANSLRGIGPGSQAPLHDRLAEIQAPVLLVVGERDPKFVRIARDLEGRLSDARVEVIPGAGHAAHLEQPDLVAERVEAFLEHCERSRMPGPPVPLDTGVAETETLTG